jgi:hypothetical protein
MTNLNKIIDNTKEYILKNSPLEDKLHVIAVVSNPCNFKIRYKLTREFIKRMENEPNVIVYLVELAYGDQLFEASDSNNKRHLQIRTDSSPLWHKENMVNLGVRHLLPSNWKAMAWIDADIEFDNPHWALDTLKLLNGGYDFVQLFTHCIDMDFNRQIMNTFTGFGYQYLNNFEKGTGQKYWHPGFAWACNRKTYNKIGGILEASILGSGDNIMCHCFLKKATETLKKGMSQEYIDFIANFQNKMDGIKLGYVTGPIRHYFHGKKENRNYYGREDILIKYQYNPYNFITYDERGLIIPTEKFPEDFLKDIMNYFKNRNEDEMVIEEIMSKDKSDKDVLEYKINFILHEFEKLRKRIGVNEEDVSKATKEISQILSMNTTNSGDVPEIVPTVIKNKDDIIKYYQKIQSTNLSQVKSSTPVKTHDVKKVIKPDELNKQLDINNSNIINNTRVNMPNVYTILNKTQFNNAVTNASASTSAVTNASANATANASANANTNMNMLKQPTTKIDSFLINPRQMMNYNIIKKSNDKNTGFLPINPPQIMNYNNTLEQPINTLNSFPDNHPQTQIMNNNLDSNQRNNIMIANKNYQFKHSVLKKMSFSNFNN